MLRRSLTHSILAEIYKSIISLHLLLKQAANANHQTISASVSCFKAGLGKFFEERSAEMNTLDRVQAAKVEEEMREQREWTATQKKTGGDSRATSQLFKSRFTELKSCHLHLSGSLDIASRRKV